MTTGSNGDSPAETSLHIEAMPRSSNLDYWNVNIPHKKGRKSTPQTHTKINTQTKRSKFEKLITYFLLYFVYIIYLSQFTFITHI